jgi:hypothetical protein
MRPFSATTFLSLALTLFCATATHASEPERLPITTLMMRDQVITIANGSNGLLYTVSTLDGKELDTHLDDAQLQAKYPDLYESIRPAIANTEAQSNIMIWGGLQHVK